MSDETSNTQGPMCPYCRSIQTKIRGVFCRQIHCMTCHARGPAVRQFGGYPAAAQRAAMFWTGPSGTPPSGRHGGSSVMPPSYRPAVTE